MFSLMMFSVNDTCGRGVRMKGRCVNTLTQTRALRYLQAGGGLLSRITGDRYDAGSAMRCKQHH